MFGLWRGFSVQHSSNLDLHGMTLYLLAFLLACWTSVWGASYFVLLLLSFCCFELRALKHFAVVVVVGMLVVVAFRFFKNLTFNQQCSFKRVFSFSKRGSFFLELSLQQTMM